MKDDVAELVLSYPKHSLQEITKKKKGRTRDKDFLLSSPLFPFPFFHPKQKKNREKHH
jgi:hypothetical protein